MNKTTMFKKLTSVTLNQSRKCQFWKILIDFSKVDIDEFPILFLHSAIKCKKSESVLIFWLIL